MLCKFTEEENPRNDLSNRLWENTNRPLRGDEDKLNSYVRKYGLYKKYPKFGSGVLPEVMI